MSERGLRSANVCTHCVHIGGTHKYLDVYIIIKIQV